MNEIKVPRMLLAGVVMFVVWIAVEILVEHVLAQVFFGQTSAEMWLEAIEMPLLSGPNYWINSFVAVFNCTIMIWLYASLRPMYGVGTKAALIASAFFIAWLISLFVNLANLGLIPAWLAFLEACFESIELPIAMIAGAGVYEGKQKGDREAG